MSDDMVAWLRPWQSIPDTWRCAVCSDPATAYLGARGVVVFHCPDHRFAAEETHLSAHGLDECAGRQSLRMSWGYWLRSLYWRARNLVNRKGARHG